MPDQLQLRGGTTVQHSTFTGASKEVTVDTTKKTAVVHDGSTVGGNPLMREDASNSALALGSAGTPSLKWDANTGIYSPGADQLAVATNGTGRLFVDATGNVGVGAAANANGVLRLNVASGNNANLVFSENNTDRYILGQVTGDNALRVYDIVAASERLRITSGGLVGIGTSSPANPLHIRNDAGTPQIKLDYLGSSSTIFGSSDLFLQPNGATAMTLKSGGNVGIGTTSPTRSLEVAVGVTSNNGILVTGNNSPGILITETSGNVNLNLVNDSSGAYLGTSSNHPVVLRTNNTERARLDTSGRLLVGTSTSRAVTAGTSGNWEPRLQVTKTGIDAANIAAYSFSTYAVDLGGGLGIGPDIVLARSNSDTEGTQAAIANNMLLGRITFNGSDGTAFQSGAFIAAASDGQTWASGDCPTRLVFSTTADGASSPTERMRIESTGRTGTYVSASDGFQVSSNAAAGTTHANFVGRHDGGAPFGGTVSLQIWNNGNVQNTNNSYTAISDIKLKENVVDANSQWSDIKALQVRNYNLKEGQTHTQIGLVAQEVELISPGLVGESPDRDEDGNDLGTVTKSVNYSVLYMKAVKALQEAMERIESLEAKVAALESA
jgi:hypothetical protein